MSRVTRVFIVDDEPSVRRAISRLLRSENYDVMAFGSPEEFLENYNPAAPGCLILDATMPGLNGLDLQQKLASLGATLPIIFISGRIDPSTRVKALNGGALDFLAKPVDAETLLACVQRAIEAGLLNRHSQLIHNNLGNMPAHLQTR